ncbi:MAG TPA: phosphoribosyltransferase family protein [Chitinophagales bacterium]|nr:phosphoribosyltransferase family protein [Chitinophagales bacterium]
MEVINRTAILNADDIKKKIERISYEILENNSEEGEIILAGVRQKGFVFAQRLEAQLHKMSDLTVILTDIQLQKRRPTSSEILMGIDSSSVNNKVVIVCDDVANTGQTLLYAMKPFLDFSPKKIQVAVLVDRRHKSYPVSADYVGLSLSTNMQEHITVEIGMGIEEAVYLS